MNKSIFGKTQEISGNHVSVELITDARILRKWIAKPSFRIGNLVTDCLTVIQCGVAALTLNRVVKTAHV